MKKLTIPDISKPLVADEMEQSVINYWDEHQVFEKTISSRPDTKPYVFYDGPPFATGLPHYGHILASTTKDVIPRYWTMKGYRVERKWGWDCHGLPVENIVEKELQLPDKRAIENYGIGNFNEACRSAVLRYATEWKSVIHRLGRFVDMENDYKTMEPWYMESLWWVFSKLWEKGLIYKGHKSMHICPRCETPLSNFEVTQGYKEVKDISVYVSFTLRNRPEKIIAWTTTPWTLPGNVLLAVNEKVEYVVFSLPSKEGKFIAAKAMLSQLCLEETPTIYEELTGKDLVGETYVPLFPYYQNTQNAFKVVAADFVALEEGSGIVHIAPAFGEDDYKLGKQYAVPFVQHVGMNGRFKQEVTDFADLTVKPIENPVATDVEIIKYLAAHGNLFGKKNITHSYPHCWRCDTPLINYATDSWFVDVTKIKQQMLDNNQAINWLPSHIKDGRFGDWLENARDWAISRNRYWGTPLPIWQAEDGTTICIGSIAELEKFIGAPVKDIHKHFIDQLSFQKDGKLFKRIPEVLDCWFESGAMPYASFHYPFENKAEFEASFPAEFISEGQDQTRGWFYTLHVLATALTMGPNPAIPVKQSSSSFKNCIVSGIVLAEDGKKMAKRLQNYPDPMMIVQKYGADSLRFYLMSSPVVRAENLNFSEKGVEEIRKRVINIMWNIVAFYSLYKPEKTESDEFLTHPSHVMDQWLTARSHQLTKQVTAAMDQYDVITASRELMDFVDEFSTWYVRLSRERIKDTNTNQEPIQTLRAALINWAKLAAPFAPFITETIYQTCAASPNESLHLEMLSTVMVYDESVLSDMDKARVIVNNGHGARKAQNISLKQPLQKITVTTNKPLSSEYEAVICQELNLKEIVWATGEQLEVALDTTLTDELIQEGKARIVIRDIQAARKALNVSINDEVMVTLPEWPASFEEEIKRKVKAKSLTKGDVLTVTACDKQ
jgi:isoleucyl-tRNA synthetase